MVNPVCGGFLVCYGCSIAPLRGHLVVNALMKRNFEIRCSAHVPFRLGAVNSFHVSRRNASFCGR